jgi:hypothetical protein
MNKEEKQTIKEGFMVARILYGGSKLDILRNGEFGAPNHFDTSDEAKQYVIDNKITGPVAILPTIWQTFDQ